MLEELRIKLFETVETAKYQENAIQPCEHEEALHTMDAAAVPFDKK